MRLSLALFVCLPLLSSAVTPSMSGTHAANILAEVKKHLAAGQKCLADGSYDTAEAHANLVLISDNVSVSIKYENVPDSQLASCRKALDAALAQWQTSLDDTIHFNVIDDAAKADLCVRFRPDVRMGVEPVAGMTNWSRTIRQTNGAAEGSFKADVQVRVRDTGFEPMRFEAIRQETEHELGHCLGLDDSDTQGDLMGRLDVAHLVPSPRRWEVDAVKSLRDEARQLKTDAAAKRK